VPFRDVDADIEATAGKPIPEIFIDDGEERFRALERDAVAAALAGFDGVLALGGGAILAPESREALRGHRVVFLSVELADAINRVGLGAGRPLLAINPRATMRYLLDQRRAALRGGGRGHREDRRPYRGGRGRRGGLRAQPVVTGTGWPCALSRIRAPRGAARSTR